MFKGAFVLALFLAVSSARGADPLPAWLKPGVRVTFLAMGSSGGRRPVAGVGYHQLTIVAAQPGLVAADGRHHVILDAQRKQVRTASYHSHTGDGMRLEDFWVHPAVLAQMREKDERGERVTRGRHLHDGRERDAITLEATGGRKVTRHVYDLETGLLLISTVRPEDPERKESESRVTLVDVREMKLPWMGEEPPAWVAGPPPKWEFRGTYTVEVPGAPAVPLNASIGMSIEKSPLGLMLAKCVSRISYEGLPPTETPYERCFGSAMVGGLWVAPAALRGLRADLVLDEDKHTGLKTTFGGIQGNLASIVEQGPLETNEYRYDMRTGMLSGVRIAQPQPGGLGRTVFQLQLAGG